MTGFESEDKNVLQRRKKMIIIHKRNGTLMYRMKLNHRRLVGCCQAIFPSLKGKQITMRVHCRETHETNSL